MCTWADSTYFRGLEGRPTSSIFLFGSFWCRVFGVKFIFEICKKKKGFELEFCLLIYFFVPMIL